MSPERQRQIMRVLESAQELEASERRAFLDQACAGDEALRREVESLLVADGKASRFMDGLALQDAAKLLAAQATLLDDANAPGNPYATSAPDAQAVPLAPGVVLDGRYLIERELGRGGIGVVFLARDQRLHDRPVVVKALLEQRLNGDARAWFEKKFRDEVNALARIEDPGVVHPLDAGQLADGRSYLVMEYVPGQPLSKIIPPGGLALPRAARLLRQIARALDAAHNKGIVHRDLTPNNILLQNPEAGEAEQIKLIDFGLATVRDALAASGPLKTRIAGTPPYMAPEQMNGAPEKASDIYALGVLAYQMMTGQLPFIGKSITEIAKAQQAGIKTLPCELRPELPLAAQAAILQALSLEAKDRYASATAFSEAFQQGLGEQGNDPYQTSQGSVVSLPSAQTTGPRWAWWSGGALALLLLSALLWRLPDFTNRNAPSVKPAAPATPAATERVLNYSLLVQKNPNRYPGRQPIITLGGVGVEEGDGLRLKLSSSQSGHLYIINEWPSRPNRPPGFTVLFPNPLDNRGSAKINAGEIVQLPPEGHWLRFEKEKGMEKYWLVWAEQSVPELEALTPDNTGEIRNPRQTGAVQRFLAAHPNTEFKSEPDEARQQIKLRGNGKLLVGLATLEHR